MSDTLRTVGLVAGGIVAFVVILLVGAWLVDYGVEGTVTDKGRTPQGCFVEFTTDIGGVAVERPLSCSKVSVVQRGYFVVYHLRSGTTEVYTSDDGRLIYRG